MLRMVHALLPWAMTACDPHGGLDHLGFGLTD